jgi:4-hydroxymandelate oxidase
MSQAAEILHATHAEQLACQVLPADVAAYFFGGAGDEVTLRANVLGWQDIALMPRVLRNLQQASTKTQLFGKCMDAPLLVAPMALQGLAHPQAELGMALGASAQRVGMVLSTQSNTPLQAVAQVFAQESDPAPLCFQLYWQADKARTLELVQQAEGAGYDALVLSVDAPVQGVRDRERAMHFKVPAHLRTVHWDVQLNKPPAPAQFCGGLLQGAPTWEDVAWLAGKTRLPLVLKGIAHPQDARLALQHGAGALVVSNHGGRTLDTVPATAWLLPRIAKVVDAKVPLLVDGGIRRGTDVLKAMAMGASAVLVGRPCVAGLAWAGASGTAKVLKLLKDELQIAMALSGVVRLDKLPDDLLGPFGAEKLESRRGIP